MTQPADTKAVRVLTGCVAERRTRTVEELGKALAEELTKAGYQVIRHIVVKGEAEHVQALVSNVSTANEADAIVLVGGTGFGPKDHVCEALEGLFQRQIEGFGEAYRRELRKDHGVFATLARATAGVFDGCVVFAMTGKQQELRLAVEFLVAPILGEAVAMANGREPPPRPG
jgi:molybdenum cofactor biosynthesis protein B